MPNRILKESIRTSKSINAMTDFQFRLWAYLITYVDDYGRGSADPELLKGFVFPRRKGVTEATIANTLRELASLGSIRLYEVDGESYLVFPGWEKHQTIRAKVSKFPAPPADDGACKQMQADASKCKQTQADAPDNRIRNTEYDIRYSEAEAVNDACARELSTAAAPAFDSPDFHGDLKNPITYATNELGRLSPNDMQELESFRADLPDDVIIYGIDAACSARVRTWRYARSILNRYVTAGFRSVNDVKAADEARERQKANMVSDGHGGKVTSAATGYSQRSGDDFNGEIDNSWMDDFMPKEG